MTTSDRARAPALARTLALLQLLLLLAALMPAPASAGAACKNITVVPSAFTTGCSDIVLVPGDILDVSAPTTLANVTLTWTDSDYFPDPNNYPDNLTFGIAGDGSDSLYPFNASYLDSGGTPQFCIGLVTVKACPALQCRPVTVNLTQITTNCVNSANLTKDAFVAVGPGGALGAVNVAFTNASPTVLTPNENWSFSPGTYFYNASDGSGNACNDTITVAPCILECKAPNFVQQPALNFTVGCLPANTSKEDFVQVQSVGDIPNVAVTFTSAQPTTTTSSGFEFGAIGPFPYNASLNGATCTGMATVTACGATVQCLSTFAQLTNATGCDAAVLRQAELIKVGGSGDFNSAGVNFTPPILRSTTSRPPDFIIEPGLYSFQANASAANASSLATLGTCSGGRVEVYACPAVVACASPNISLSAATTGCAAANRSLADLVSVGGGGRAAAVAVAWTGTGAQVPVTGSALSFTFVPGSYPYTANAPSGYPFTQPVGGANCSGVVTVTPCPAAPISLACANLRLNLSAAPTGCQLSVVAAKADLATVVGASADDVAISWAGAAPATVPGSSNFSFTAGTYAFTASVNGSNCSGSVIVAQCSSGVLSSSRVCSDLQVSLEPGTTGCQNTTLPVGNFVNATSPITSLVFEAESSPALLSNNFSSVTFAAGLIYRYNVSLRSGESCNGSVTILPCSPGCNPLTLGAAAPTCSASLNATAPAPTGPFFQPSTLGAAASGFTVSNSAGSQSALPVAYPIGSWSVIGVVTYPTGPVATPACNITVIDTTLPPTPVPKPGPLCFYSNESSNVPSYDVFVSDLAELPPGSYCPSSSHSSQLRIYAVGCERSIRNKRARICWPQDGEAVDINRKNAASKEVISVTLQAISTASWPVLVNNNASAKVAVAAEVYKKRSNVPKKLRATCKPVWKRHPRGPQGAGRR